MTKDVLKYLQPNAVIPIDMETTSLLVNALKKALSEHAMQEVQRLGQEIEQEPVAWGVEWGKAGDIPCVSIIKRLHGGGIEVVAVEYAPYSNAHPSQRTEQNFCSRCGKRTNDIHTCTPPKENT